MAQASEDHSAYERRIAELEHELKQRDRRITKLIDEAEKLAEERREWIEDSLAGGERWTEEAFEMVKDEAGNWTWALGAACEAYVETYNEFARDWNKGVGELGADLSQLARGGFLRLARL
jgi:hypothetical protein